MKKQKTISSREDELKTKLKKLKSEVKSLRANAALWQTYINNAPNLIFTVNRKYEITFMNYTLKGFAIEKVIGKSIFNFLPEESHKGARSAMDRAFRSGKKQSFEARGFGEKGKIAWYSTEVGPIKNKKKIESVVVIATDITNRVEAIEALKKSEQKFSLIFWKSPFAAALTGLPHGYFVEINEEFVRQFEYSHEEAIGKTSLELDLYLDSNERQRIGEIMQSNGFVRNAETKMKTKTGKIIDVLVSSDIVEIGSEKFILTTSKNITERKNLESKIIATSDRLSNVLNSITDAFITVDKDWRITYVNPEAARINKKAPHEFLGKIHWEEWPASVGTEVEFQYRKAMNEKISVHFEHHYYVEGEYDVWLDIHAYPTSEGLVLIYRNITDKKNFEAALFRSRQTLQLFVEHAPAAIAMFDKNMKYLAYSKRYLHDYNLSEQNIIGKSHYEVFPEMPERWKEIHQRCLAGAVEKADEDPFDRADGSIDWVRWEIHPWRNENGEIGGILLLSEVITERKEVQMKLQANEAQLRENNISLIRLLTQRDTHFSIANKNENLDSRLRILHLENDPNDVEMLKEILLENRINYDLVHVANKRQFLASLKEEIFDIAILDFHLDDINGVQAIEYLKNFSPDIPTIVFTGSSTELDVANMLTAGAWNYVTKEHPSRIVLAIQQAVERKRFLDEQVSVANALRKNQERFQALIENSVEGIALLDKEGGVLYGSPSTLHILGYSLEAFEGKNLFSLIHEEDINGASAAFSNLFTNSKKNVSASFRIKHNDGSFRIIEMTFTNLIDTPTVSAIVCNYRDITERSRAIEDRINLMNRLIESEEKLKKTAAQQLHDEIGQNLTALMINVNYVSTQLEDESHGKLKKRLNDSVSLLTETIEQVRNIMTELRPSVLDDYGLNAALSYSLNKFSQTNNITAQYDGKDFEPRLPIKLAYGLYRASQEALHNIAKHAHAKNIYVKLEEIDGLVRLTIRDDGIGFDYDRYSQSKSAHGLGLITIEERINFIGGNVNIISSKEEGTTMIIEAARQ